MPHKLTEWLDRLPCANGERHNLSAYLDGELERATRASLEKHLAACPRCRATLERMRFASRAMSHFVVPTTRTPAWHAGVRSLQERVRGRALLERFWTTKLSIPAPAAATFALALVCAALLSFMGPLSQEAMSVEPLPTNALVPQIKFIEVPVERERIVTRTVYVASRANDLQRAALIAKGLTRPRATTIRNREMLTATSLAGFRPATDANLRIVKEPEQ